MTNASDKRIYGGIALLVVGLGGLVWWSLPRDGVAPGPPASADAATEPPASPALATGSVERPAGATAHFVVLVDKPRDEVRAFATVEEIAKRLDAKYCGPACEAVKTFLADPDDFELEVLGGEDLILPTKETMDVVGVGLTEIEKASVHRRPSAVAIRADGPFAREHLPARAAFAATAIVADALDGLVWDEPCRRIEAARDFRGRAITARLDEPAFAPRSIVIQLYPSGGGMAHLRTLGMLRFGSPDLVVRDADVAAGPLLADVVNAAARRITDGAPLQIPRDAGAPFELDAVPTERTEGDPDNVLAELVPHDGSSWSTAVATTFGGAPSVRVAADDPELLAIAKRARASLPAALERVRAGEGELYVKGPFVIAPEARTDGGATSELLWIAASTCDATRCSGTLSNEPSHASNLAAGKTTSIARSAIVDWMLQQRDGGTAGGDSIRVLSERARRAP